MPWFLRTTRGQAGDQAAHLVGARGAAQDHAVDVAVQLRWRALTGRLRLRREIGAMLARDRHDLAAERLLLALVAREPRIEIAGRLDGARKARRIDRRLGHACAHMRARYKRGIPQERHAAEYDLRRHKVEDRLEE